MQSQQKNDKIIFGSFPFRGTMQGVRLLCEYIGVEYENKFFNPVEWEKYKQNQAKDWLYQKIPYLKCGDLVLTNSLAASQFIAQKFNRPDLIGITQQEKISINSSLSFQNIITAALSLECEMKKLKLSVEDKRAKRQVYWKEQFYPKFKRADEKCKGPWVFDHITILDFFLYEDYLLFSLIYPEMKNFNKVRQIFESVSKLPAIINYENSQTKIKQICPNRYFQNFADEYKKSKEFKPQNCKSACFTFCNQSKNGNSKSGFCPYKKQQDVMEQE